MTVDLFSQVAYFEKRRNKLRQISSCGVKQVLLAHLIDRLSGALRGAEPETESFTPAFISVTPLNKCMTGIDDMLNERVFDNRDIQLNVKIKHA